MNDDLLDPLDEFCHGEAGWVPPHPMKVSAGALPIYRSRLLIHADFMVNFAAAKPSAWCRFWYWALLGWKWEDLK